VILNVSNVLLPTLKNVPLHTVDKFVNVSHKYPKSVLLVNAKYDGTDVNGKLVSSGSPPVPMFMIIGCNGLV
jgi:hypothetical protein